MISGLAESLEKAENKAYFALTRIPNNGTIHSVYVDGKAVKTRI